MRWIATERISRDLRFASALVRDSMSRMMPAASAVQSSRMSSRTISRASSLDREATSSRRRSASSSLVSSFLLRLSVRDWRPLSCCSRLSRPELRLSREFSRCSRRSERACMSLLCWRTSSVWRRASSSACCLILSASSLASMVASRRMFSADFSASASLRSASAMALLAPLPETTRDTTKPTARQTIATTT